MIQRPSPSRDALCIAFGSRLDSHEFIAIGGGSGGVGAFAFLIALGVRLFLLILVVFFCFVVVRLVALPLPLLGILVPLLAIFEPFFLGSVIALA